MSHGSRNANEVKEVVVMKDGTKNVDPEQDAESRTSNEAHAP